MNFRTAFRALTSFRQAGLGTLQGLSDDLVEAFASLGEELGFLERALVGLLGDEGSQAFVLGILSIVEDGEASWRDADALGTALSYIVMPRLAKIEVNGQRVVRRPAVEKALQGLCRIALQVVFALGLVRRDEDDAEEDGV